MHHEHGHDEAGEVGGEGGRNGVARVFYSGGAEVHRDGVEGRLG